MENFSPELIRAQTEAELMKEKIKSGDAKTYNEAEKLVEFESANGNESSLAAGSALEKVKNTEEGSSERKVQMAEFKTILEKSFQKFITEFGVPKFEDTRDFLVYWDKFHQFLVNEGITSNVGYDYALRFNTEIALSSPSLSEGNKQALREYLLNCGPYNCADYSEITPLTDKLGEEAEDKDQLVNDLSLIIENDSINRIVTDGPFSCILAVAPELSGKLAKIIKERDIDIFDGADNEFVNIWRKNRGSYRDITQHANLHDSQMLNIRRKISKKYSIAYEDNEDEQELIAKKAVSVFKKDFGIDIEKILDRIKQ